MTDMVFTVINHSAFWSMNKFTGIGIQPFIFANELITWNSKKNFVHFVLKNKGMKGS